jgi:hypothetical protein
MWQLRGIFVQCLLAHGRFQEDMLFFLAHAASSRGRDELRKAFAQGTMTFALAIIGVAIGVVLGLRYKVLILVPALISAMLFAIGVGIVRAESFWSIVLTAVALVTAVQLGYLVGSVIHAAIAAIWPPQNGDGKPDSKIGHTSQYIWQLPGWPGWESIVYLHQPLPPQV